MRRFTLMLLLVFALFAFPALAQDETIQITFPPPVYSLQGTFEITGTVNPPDLQNYFFELADYNADPEHGKLDSGHAAKPHRRDRRGAGRGEYGDDAGRHLHAAPAGAASIRRDDFYDSGSAPHRQQPSASRRRTRRPGGQRAGATCSRPPNHRPRRRRRSCRVRQSSTTCPSRLAVSWKSFDDNAAALMHQAGMTWVKWQIPFTIGDNSLVDVARDRINWSHQNGFLAFLSIKGDKNELDQQDTAYYPLYAEFVGKVSALQPDAIQVWNEENLDREWPQGKIDPRRYAELLRQAYQAIKAVDPSIMVVTGAPSPTGAEGAFGLDRVWNDDRYYLGMANAGVASNADCLGIHYNEGIISPRQQSGDPRGDYPTYYFPLMMQRALNPFNSSLPLCFSELGYLSPDGYGALPAGFAWGANTTVQDQASWLADAVQLAAATGKVHLIIVFNVDFTQFVDNDPQGGYAIIRRDGSCPACDALAAMRGAG